jgi:hypothetical protein
MVREMLRLLPLVLLLGAIGCGPDPLTCAELERDADGGMLTCNPLSPPSYDNVYRDTFEEKCATGHCHSGPGAKGGLDLEDKDAGYEDLLEVGQERVIPGEPECSEVVARIYTTDSDWHMPPGEDLSAEEKCSIAKWIDMGAPR